jgi:hypothetical protein
MMPSPKTEAGEPESEPLASNETVGIGVGAAAPPQAVTAKVSARNKIKIVGFICFSWGVRRTWFNGFILTEDNSV